MDRTIIDYYDRLALSYDADRFGNSYGRFLDVQERDLLSRLLPVRAARVLDLGCGTGRLSDRASYCCDASIESLRPGGVCIADVASALRRRLLGRIVSRWHGGTSLTRAEFANIAAGAGLRMTEYATAQVTAPVDAVALPSLVYDNILYQLTL